MPQTITYTSPKTGKSYPTPWTAAAMPSDAEQEAFEKDIAAKEAQPVGKPAEAPAAPSAPAQETYYQKKERLFGGKLGLGSGNADVGVDVPANNPVANGGGQMMSGVKHMVTGEGGRMNAGSDIIEGGAGLGLPVMLATAPFNPLAAARALAMGTAGHYVGKGGAELVGASPEAQRLAGNVGSLAGVALDKPILRGTAATLRGGANLADKSHLSTLLGGLLGYHTGGLAGAATDAVAGAALPMGLRGAAWLADAAAGPRGAVPVVPEAVAIPKDIAQVLKSAEAFKAQGASASGQPAGPQGAASPVLTALVKELQKGKLPTPEGPQGMAPKTLSATVPEPTAPPKPEMSTSGVPAKVQVSTTPNSLSITEEQLANAKRPTLAEAQAQKAIDDAIAANELTPDVPSVTKSTTDASGRSMTERFKPPAPEEGEAEPVKEPVKTKNVEPNKNATKPREAKPEPAKPAQEPIKEPVGEEKGPAEGPAEPPAKEASEPRESAGWDASKKDALLAKLADDASKGKNSPTDLKLVDDLESQGIPVEDAYKLVKTARATRADANYKQAASQAEARRAAPAPDVPLKDALQASLDEQAALEAAKAAEGNNRTVPERLMTPAQKEAARVAEMRAARLKASGGSFAIPQVKR